MMITSCVQRAKTNLLYECSSQELEPYNHAVTWSEWNKAEPTPLLEQTLKIIHNFEHIEVEVKAVKTQEDAEMLTESSGTAAERF